MFLSMRRWAVPTRPVQEHGGLHGLHRGARRELAHTGQVGSQLPDIHKAAVEAAKTTDALISGNEFLVWLDNWCWLRYTTDPEHVSLSQNLSVIAILPLTEAVVRAPAGRLRSTGMPAFGGHFDMMDMIRRLTGVAALTNSSLTTMRRSTDHIQASGLQLSWIRVPLDLRRTNMVSLQWRSYLLSELVVSSNLDLLKLMDCLRRLQLRSMQTMPLLVDENIHYRLLRMMHSEGSEGFDVAGWLRRIPLLFGIWHGYKHTLVVVYRAFFPLFALLECTGEPVVGQIPRCERKVLYLEKLFGALLVAGAVVLSHLETRLGLVRERYRQQCQIRGNQGSCRNYDTISGWDNYLPTGSVELRVLSGLHTLLTKYLPLVFSLGYRVRRCAWEGRVDGTVKGIVAKGVIEHCFVTQLHLLQDWECKAEYTKSLACALLSWRLEYSRMPACLFVEEACEAMLSRMASRVRAHPHLASFRQTLDLYLSLPRPSLAARGTRGGIRVGLVSLMVQRLQGLITNATSLKFAKMSSARRSVWEAAFPEAFQFPTWVPERMDSDRLQGVFQCALVHMAGSRVVSHEVHEFLHKEVPLRGHEGARRQRQSLE